MPAHSCDILCTGPDKASTSLPSVPPEIKTAIGCKCRDYHPLRDAAMKANFSRMPARPFVLSPRTASSISAIPSCTMQRCKHARIGSCFSGLGIRRPKSNCQYFTPIVGRLIDNPLPGSQTGIVIMHMPQVQPEKLPEMPRPWRQPVTAGSRTRCAPKLYREPMKSKSCNEY
jgi:hypothetical protein